jgi:type I restriction enzyme S subunit
MGGWDTASIGEVCDIVNGGTPKTDVPGYWGGPHRWITPAEMGKRATPYIDQTNRTITDQGLQNSSARPLPKNSVILSSRAPIGHLVINTVPMATNQGCKGLVPCSRIDHKFLYYYLVNIVELLNELGTGTTFKELSGTKLKEVRVPLPPVAEQLRIVAILNEAFEGIATAKANAEKNLQNARELFESALDTALERRGAGYDETSLGDEIELLAGYAFPSKGYTNAPDGVRLLRGDNIMQGYFRWDDAKAWPANDIAPYARFVLEEGDVVLAMDRPWVKAGLKRAQIGADDLPCLQLQRTARLRPRRRIKADFLYHLTGSNSFSAHLLGVQTGLGVPHISGKQIECFRFMLPSPSEQEALAYALDDLQQRSERLQEIYQQKVAALDELKQSLLHQAFTGKLTEKSADKQVAEVA